MPKMIVCKGDCGEAFTDEKEAHGIGWRIVTKGRWMCPDCMAKIAEEKLFQERIQEIREKHGMTDTRRRK